MTQINFTKPPKILINLFSTFRKWKLKLYKKKKVRKEKTSKDRIYFVKFSMRITDQINPQKITKKYQMMVPAKAAFFAKRKAIRSIVEKLDFDFLDCEQVTDEGLESFENSREKYLSKKMTVFYKNLVG